MKKFASFYVKIVIKNPAFFYSFLFAFLLVFLAMSLTLKLDVFESHSAVMDGTTITIPGEITPPSDSRVYYYANRNEKVYAARWEEIDEAGGATRLTLSGGAAELEGGITVELVVGSQTLLERIFVRGGRAR